MRQQTNDTAPTYGLTPLQQNMYASASLTARPWQYLEQIVVHLPTEGLDAAAMGQAWSELTQAHPALRNVIVADTSGVPMQQRGPFVTIQPTEHDWRAYDATQVDDALRNFLTQDRTQGVDATKAPAFRVAIFHTGTAQSALVWTVPHSLLDGRAFTPLLDEVFQRYARIDAGGAAADFASEPADLFEEHCRKLTDLSHTRGEAHFAKTLEGWEGSEGLVRTGVKPTRQTECALHLTQAQTDAVTRLAQQAEVTTSTVILAAWGTVLARFSGQADVVFGNTRNGRHLVAGSADAAGCFIATVPVRLQLNSALTLGTMLQTLRAEQIAVRPFEHTPLTRIARRLDIPPGRQIFDSVLMFDQGTLDEQLKRHGDAWLNRSVDLLEEGDMPVSVAAYMGPQLRVVVEYDPALVPNGARLAACLQQFLIGLGDATPDSLLGGVSMLDTQAVAQMTDLAGPETIRTSDVATCLDRFEQNAGQSPDHIALMQPDSAAITYGALDQAATRLAANLALAGVQHGDTIGICMARGAPFITAMLAIWKAGAAFVPMDPGYPQDTLNIIAQDSDARLVLTDAAAPPLEAPTRDIADLDDATATLPPQPRSGDDLAYVIFTSGSTGRPKGVMITHRSLAAHSAAILPLFGLTAQDKVLQFAALSFDVALEEIIPTLVSGATLVLRSDAMAKSVPEFLDQSEALGITVANLPTGFWVALTDVLDTHDHPFPPLIRLMIVGGERVPLSVLKRWRQRLPDVRWLNGYGPTETTITCTTHEATAQDLIGETVPIGRPLSHARAWVLAADGALVPEGAEGELFISGPAVAKGYINNPERTAQSFGNAPFADVGRVYGTGDRVVWQRGLLHYLGRMDRQIKLRGFRIEPGQIEAALEMQDSIERAHADVLDIGGGQPQLVAWYSAPAGSDLPTPEAVRASLLNTLPPQMQPVPIAVTHWPQTPGGKIDVARLPHPELTSDSQTDAAGTDSPLVQKVATLFAQVLQVENVGPATSFFDAGGDSLSLLRLMPELERAFDVRLEPTAIYGDPTPRGVVRALQDQDPDPLVVIPIQPEGTHAPLYAVHVLGDNGSYFRPLSEVLGDTQPVFGLTVGLLSDSTPTTVPDIAEFYLRQIERHHPEGPLSLIAVSAGSYVTLELAQQLHDAGRDVQALILLDAEGPAGRARIGPVARIGVHLGHILRQGWPYITGHLATRREVRAQNAAHQRLQSNDNTGAEIQADEIGGVADFVAANMIAIEAYEPQPYPKRLTIYRAGDDRFDSKVALETGLGWGSIAAGGFDLSDVPGDHLGILDPPNVQTLGTRIKALLHRLRDPQG